MEKKRLSLFFLLALASASLAASISDLASALDLNGQKGITLVSSSKIVFKTDKDEDGYYDYVYIDADAGDEIENRKTKSVDSNSGWTVQKGASDNVSPVKGSTCLRSALPDANNARKASSDAQLARLVFKVYGPGTFSFVCRTACDSGDSVNVYVDGELSPDSPGAEGYGPEDEFGWGYAYDDTSKEDYRGYYAIKVDEGVAPTGSAYAGTYFHEIRLEFEKDLPKYELDDNDKAHYVKDGPDEDDVDYDEYKNYFHNCVWIDDVGWEPAKVFLEFYEEDVYEDVANVFMETNVKDFGYMVKYTTDGSEPVSTSPNYDSEDGIEIKQDATLKAAVFYKDVADMNGNGNTSEILKYTSNELNVVSMNVKIRASAPTIAMDESLSSDTALAIVISKSYEPNVIRYTLDGTEPSDASPIYEGPILISESKTIKAICTREGIASSEADTLVFDPVGSPTITIDNGLSTDTSLAIVISSEDESTVIRYTMDGTEPDSGSPVYDSPIILTEFKVVKAICTKYGILKSEMVSIEPDVVPEPTVRPVNATDDSPSSWVTTANILKVAASAEDGITIKYGNAGNVSKKYVSVVSMDAANHQTLCFQAFAFGKLPSEIVTVTAYKADTDFSTGKLTSGWNLLSIPMTVARESFASVPTNYSFYGYDKTRKCYVRASSLEEGRAYWVFSPNATSAPINFRGTVIGSFKFESGWTLGGPGAEGASIPSGVKAFEYQNGSFQQVSKLLPGVGYWIYK